MEGEVVPEGTEKAEWWGMIDSRLAEESMWGGDGESERVTCGLGPTSRCLGALRPAESHLWVASLLPGGACL